MARENERQRLTTKEDIEGIFRTVGSFLDILSDMLGRGELPVKRKGEAEFGERKGMKAKAVYGFSLKLEDQWQSGMPSLLEWKSPEGNGSAGEQAHEPPTDNFDEKETVVVVAEIPGVSGRDINVEVRLYPWHHS